MELRCDLIGAIPKTEQTPQGGLRAPAYLTRIGVFTYTRPDGSKFREARLPEEVFSEESLASLRGAPVVVGHPASITSGNWKEHAVGHVADNVKANGRFVASDVLVQDATTVGKVENRDLVELSCGYECQLELTSGEYEGEKYDGIQRAIRYNHVGLGPSGWGRAGSAVKLKLDSADPETSYSHYAYSMEPVVKDDKLTPAPTVNVNVDLAEHTQIQKKCDALEGENTALKSENEKLKSQLDPKRIDGLVNERFSLVESARKVLGADAKFDGQSDREVMTAAVKVASPDLKLDGKSDDFVRGVFTTLAANYDAAAVKVAELRANVGGTSEQDDGKIDKARKDNEERQANAWKSGSGK